MDLLDKEHKKEEDLVVYAKCGNEAFGKKAVPPFYFLVGYPLCTDRYRLLGQKAIPSY